MKKFFYYLLLIFNNIISDKLYTNLLFFFNCVRKNKSFYVINFENPSTFNEKINYIKFFDKNPIYPIVADKFLVRKHITNLGLKKYLIPIIKVYEHYDEINLDELIFPCVMKFNKLSGHNLILQNKSTFRENFIKNFFKNAFEEKSYLISREWHYSKIKPKILVEKLISKNINDYKFYCTKGKPRLIQIDTDRFIKHKRNFYDFKWKPKNFELVYEKSSKLLPKPNNLNDMINLSSIISKNFDFCRVDLYSHENRIYFGEITIHPEGGVGPFASKKMDYQFAKFLKI